MPSNRLTAKEFNEKFRISQELQNKFNLVPESKKQTITSIAGKPKKLILEIIKRFFSNPVVVIAFVIFITLLLCSIIIPSKAARWYVPNQEVSPYDNIKLLPPLSKPLLKDQPIDDGSAFVNVWKQIQKLPQNLRHYFDFFLKTVKFNGETKSIDTYTPSGINLVSYNAYAFYKAATLLSFVNKAISEGQTINNAFIDDALSKIPELHTLLGTTHLGADIWTTTWYATWKAIWIALVAAIVQTFIGVSIGAFLGFHAGKKIDTIAMRIIDIFLSLPDLIWLLLFTTIFGATQSALIGALIITGWAYPVSATRMFVITVKDEEYIIAAKSVGANTSRQVFVHALPAVLGKIATNFVRRIPSIILSVASLAFLGFFKEKSDINLGQMLIENTPYAAQNPWTLALPATILLILSLSLHFIAMGVHDALDPKVIVRGKRK